MRKFVTRGNVRLGTGLLVVLGAISALYGNLNVATAVVVVLVGSSVVLGESVHRQLRSSRSWQRQLSDGLKRERSRGITRGRTIRRIRRQVRDVDQKLRGLEELVRQAERRQLGAFEAERIRAAERQRELSSIISTKMARFASLDGNARGGSSELTERIRREVSKAVQHETSELEALLQLFARVEPRALTPPTGGWAMNARTLLHLVDLTEQHSPRLVLELGGGTSTIFLGYLLKATGGRLVSVDHEETYAELTRDAIRRHGLTDVVDVRLAPLVPIESGSLDAPRWYDVSVFSDLEGIDLLVIDGPPRSVDPMVRRHALPQLHSRLRSDSIIVLDDTQRTEEDEIAESWARDFGFVRRERGVSRLAVLQRAAD